ncbi:MAG: hydrogenase expression/formation protein HypE [Acidobacteria bacterium]|uniref:Hydrogenase expression/formation protein HypE n=1 Tax=Candidatus Polarisedimenticola svalbardensis TaxID=2886004 RepID=A0A8J6Y7W9_9BACT|nr:hydrogenase expression/formation protein HypE [Candidatus Polarisedimenticola svalbardensis]
MSCPLPLMDHDTIQLAHGAGGLLSADLIEKLILPRFTCSELEKLEDQAVLDLPPGRLAFSTDTFVVSPIFFPGGDIGDLAINGTVNDVAMSGAKPAALSAGFVLEEGFPLADFHRVLCSMETAAAKAGVRIVTGDTKVVGRGSCDKIFINTSGVGVIPEGVRLSAGSLEPGDVIILSGSLADHGMAVMTVREGLSFRTTVVSDTAALNGLVDSILAAGPGTRTLRDPTRGGAATTLNEFARASRVGIKLIESALVVRDDVAGACEILGIDPLYVANEGKLIAVVRSAEAEAVLAAMRAHEYGKDAAIIGRVVSDHPGRVTIQTGLGTERIVDMPVGEQLPRIC